MFWQSPNFNTDCSLFSLLITARFLEFLKVFIVMKMRISMVGSKCERAMLSWWIYRCISSGYYLNMEASNYQ